MNLHFIKFYSGNDKNLIQIINTQRIESFIAHKRLLGFFMFLLYFILLECYILYSKLITMELLVFFLINILWS
jgi:hypothetical protein